MENKTLEQLQQDLAKAKAYYNSLNRPALSGCYAKVSAMNRIDAIEKQIREQNNK